MALRKPLELAFKNFMDTGVKRQLDSPVVITHGLFGRKTHWLSIGKSLQQELRSRPIVAIDLRNHGDSPHSDEMDYPIMVEDMVTLLPKVTKSNRAIFVGYSMGAKVSAALALMRPHMVEKLVIADLAIKEYQPTEVDPMVKYIQALKAIQLPANLPLPVAKNIVDQQLMQSIPDTSIRQLIVTNLHVHPEGHLRWKANFDVLERTFNDSLIKFPHELLRNTFDGPTLVIRGEKSPYLKDADISAMQKLFPKMTFKVIKGAGHALHIERPDEFVRLLVDFIR